MDPGRSPEWILLFRLTRYRSIERSAFGFRLIASYIPKFLRTADQRSLSPRLFFRRHRFVAQGLDLASGQRGRLVRSFSIRLPFGWFPGEGFFEDLADRF